MVEKEDSLLMTETHEYLKSGEKYDKSTCACCGEKPIFSIGLSSIKNIREAPSGVPFGLQKMSNQELTKLN